jgi:DNA-binding NarL/FixJ family response regulator
MSRRRTLTPEREAKLIELFQQGKRQNDIAKELGLTRMTVYNYVQRLFPDRKKRGMYDENATGFFCVERYKRVATM